MGLVALPVPSFSRRLCVWVQPRLPSRRGDAGCSCGRYGSDGGGGGEEKSPVEGRSPLLVGWLDAVHVSAIEDRLRGGPP